MLFIVIVAVAAALGGSKSSSSSSSSTTAATHRPSRRRARARSSRPLTRAEVCTRLARFVDGYDCITEHTSVRAYDILYHSLHVSCPKQTRAAQLVGVLDRPACKTLAQSRFTCQAVHDPYLAPLDTADLEADLPAKQQ